MRFSEKTIYDMVVRVARAELRQAVGVVDVIDLGAKARALPPAIKRKAQKVVQNAVKDTYYREIPLGDIMEGLERLGIVVMQEDGTPWSGFLTGREGQAYFDMGYEGIPVKNAQLALTWYKMPSGKYEIVAYIG